MQLTDVGVKCPKCGIRFTSRIAHIIEDSGARDSELRSIPANPQEKFEHYSMCTCPSCGNSDWATFFSPEWETHSVLQQNVPPHLQYRQGAIEAERQGKDWYSISLYYLYAAWCADDIEALPQAREYRRLAVDALHKCLRDESFPPGERSTIEYLIGELMRRGGAFGESVNHFRECVPRLPAKFAFMARKLMRLAEMQNAELIPFDTSGV